MCSSGFCLHLFNNAASLSMFTKKCSTKYIWKKTYMRTGHFLPVPTHQKKIWFELGSVECRAPSKLESSRSWNKNKTNASTNHLATASTFYRHNNAEIEMGKVIERMFKIMNNYLKLITYDRRPSQRSSNLQIFRSLAAVHPGSVKTVVRPLLHVVKGP